MHFVFTKAARFIAPFLFRKGEIFSLKTGELAGIKIRVNDPRESMQFRLHGPTWEQDHFEFIRRLFDGGVIPGSRAVICDIGAHIGIYSSWLDRLYRGDCVIHAFEPLPEAMERLKDGLKLNDIRSVSAVQAALAGKTGEVEFFLGCHHSSSTIVKQSGAASFKVNSIALDDYFLGADPKPLPHFMKIDIEGGGIFAMAGMLEVARRCSPVIMMDSHNPDEDRAIGQFLRQLDWQAYRLDTRQWVVNHDAASPDPQGVWGTMLLCSREKAERVRGVLAKR